MAIETVDQPSAPTSAQSWPHQGLLMVTGTPAVVFNSNASAKELIAWAHGQTQMAVRLLLVVIPEPDRESPEGHAVGAVHALLEPVEAALQLALDELQEMAEDEKRRASGSLCL